jgi:hypothetical protein
MIESLRKVRARGVFLFPGTYAGEVSEESRTSKKMKNNMFGRGVNGSVVAAFVGILTVAIISDVFIEKQSFFMIGLGAAIIMSSRKRHAKVIA